MKDLISYIVLTIIGVLIGLWVCRQWFYPDAETIVQRDTIVVRDTIHYTKEKIVTKSILVEKPETIYVKVTEVIYKDSIQYLALPRQHYYTTTKDVEIWHSGIESSIDSLNVFRSTLLVTEKKVAKNVLSIGIEAEYIGRLAAPLSLQYERTPNKWFSYSGKVGYDVVNKQVIIGAGGKVRFQW